MNNKEKHILEKFNETLKFDRDFDKISNKIDYTQIKTKKPSFNIKGLSTIFACFLTLAVIIPFSIDYFNNHVTAKPSESISSETITSEVESITENLPSESVQPSVEIVTNESTVEQNKSEIPQVSTDTFPEEPEAMPTLTYQNQTFELYVIELEDSIIEELLNKAYETIGFYNVYFDDLLAYNTIEDKWYSIN